MKIALFRCTSNQVSWGVCPWTDTVQDVDMMSTAPLSHVPADSVSGLLSVADMVHKLTSWLVCCSSHLFAVMRPTNKFRGSFVLRLTHIAQVGHGGRHYLGTPENKRFSFSELTRCTGLTFLLFFLFRCRSGRTARKGWEARRAWSRRSGRQARHCWSLWTARCWKCRPTWSCWCCWR